MATIRVGGEPRVVPTTALGYRFRSTTEARWAIFMHALGVEFEYEHETYDLGDYLGWYLPDFWLPRSEVFLEVKPSLNGATDPLETPAQRKAAALAAQTGQRVLIAHGWGAPDDWQDPIVWNPRPGWIEVYWPEGWDSDYAFTACVCGAVGVSFNGRTDYISGHRCPARDTLPDHRGCRDCPGKYSQDWQRLRQAYAEAQGFRPGEQSS